MKTKIYLACLFLLSFLQAYGQPENRWGTYTQQTTTNLYTTNATHPYIEGQSIILLWSNLEPMRDTFRFQTQIYDLLENLDDNDKYCYLKVWVAPDHRIPSWLFSAPDNVPSFYIGTTLWPYYLNANYKTRFHNMINQLTTYINTELPENLKKRILFVQSCEGSTGDEGCYKGTPPSQYAISDSAWTVFRREAWEVFLDGLIPNGKQKFGFAINANELPDYQYITEYAQSIADPGEPLTLGTKEGTITHGYHSTFENDILDNLIEQKEYADSVGVNYFCRGEFNAWDNPDMWISKNSPQAVYWSAMFTLHAGIDMFNITLGGAEGSLHQDGMVLMNKYAGQHIPEESQYAYIALRRGLDVSDSITFPVATYGTCVRNNETRYTNIENAFSSYGAHNGDMPGALAHTVDSRKREFDNDIGWGISRGNWQEHLSQINENTTSDGYWNADTTVYGKFSRGFKSGQTNMYFNLNDDFFGGATGPKKVKVTVTYRDKDAGKWRLRYDAISDNSKLAGVITNSTTGDIWKKATFTITDGNFTNSGPSGCDLQLYNVNGTACRFQMIEVERIVQPVTSVTLSGCPTTNLVVNGTKQLTVTVIPDTASYKTVRWSSSDASIVSVSSTGLIKAESVGTATITVTSFEGAKTATCTVVVDAQTAYNSQIATIPGTIEGENYDEGGQGIAFNDDATKQGTLTFRAADNVDVATKTTGSNGKAVGFTLAGEWLEYTVNVDPDTYDITFKYFCNTTSAIGDLKISLDGVEITTITDIVSQGSSTIQGSTTVTGISITGGNYKVLKLEYVNGVKFDIDALIFTPELKSAKVLPEITNEIEDSPLVSVYPNPASSLLNIKIANEQAGDKVTIFNSIGQLVYTEMLGAELTIIDLIPLNLKGFAVVEVVSSGTLSKQKIMIESVK